MKKITLGISSCLLGNEVRHDGGHKRNIYVLNTLSEYFNFRALLPGNGYRPRHPASDDQAQPHC